MAVYLDDFYNTNDRNLDFFCKIDIFSETIRMHFVIWGIKHYLTLLVKSIQDHGWINFQTDGILGEIFPGFMWDPYRVTLELSRDPNVIMLAS